MLVQALRQIAADKPHAEEQAAGVLADACRQRLWRQAANPTDPAWSRHHQTPGRRAGRQQTACNKSRHLGQYTADPHNGLVEVPLARLWTGLALAPAHRISKTPVCSRCGEGSSVIHILIQCKALNTTQCKHTSKNYSGNVFHGTNCTFWEMIPCLLLNASKF